MVYVLLLILWMWCNCSRQYKYNVWPIACYHSFCRYGMQNVAGSLLIVRVTWSECSAATCHQMNHKLCRVM